MFIFLIEDYGSGGWFGLLPALHLWVNHIFSPDHTHLFLYLTGLWHNVHRSNLQPQVKVCVKVLVAQSCLTLCNPRNCGLPGSSACGILQAWILEWVAVPSSRGSSQPRDWTRISHISCIGTLAPSGKPTWLTYSSQVHRVRKYIGRCHWVGVWWGFRHFSSSLSATFMFSIWLLSSSL